MEESPCYSAPPSEFIRRSIWDDGSFECGKELGSHTHADGVEALVRVALCQVGQRGERYQ